MNKNLAIFIRSYNNPIPRVERMMNIAQLFGFECEYFGGIRTRNLPKEDNFNGFKVYRMGYYTPLLNGKNFFLYLKFIFTMNLSILVNLFKKKPSLIHVSDFELFFSSKLYSIVHGAKIIYNIHDNFSQRYNLPKFLKKILNVFEGINVISSDITLVPEEFRKNSLPRWCHYKVSVVKNSPEDPQFDFKNNTSEKIKIFFGGWIDEGRGIEKLIKLSENETFQITIAGEGDRKLIKKIKSSDSIKYLGFIQHKQVIDITRESDYIWALYDPKREINRYAASNKIAEALGVGRPIIINKELEIFKTLRKYNCYFSIKYEQDINQISQLLIANKNYASLSKNARKAFDENYSWYKIKQSMVDVYEKIS